MESDTKPLDVSALTPEAVKAISALVVALVQPIYTTAEAQLSATLMIGQEMRRLADAVETFAPVPGELISGEVETAVECQHPEDRRKSFATNVDDDFFCLDCQTMVKRPHAAKES